MKKRLISMIGILGITMLMLGCEKNNEGKVKSTHLKVAFNQSENHPQFRALKTFGEKLEKETNGEYSLEISPNALLGDQKSASELVQSGVIQMAVVGNPVIENYNKDFAVIGLPYVYDSLEHQEKVFTSGILSNLFKSTDANGFKVVGAFTAGSRNIYTNKAIKEPNDLSGLKIRVMQSNTMKKMLDYMGGVGTPMSQSEVYTAIQQGVLDGGENNEVTYADLKHYEVAPYFSYTQHLMVPDLIIINSNIYNEMTDKNQEIFDKLMKETISEEFIDWNKSVEKAKKISIENGAIFVDVSIEKFQNNVKPLQEDVIKSSKLTKKVYSEIRSLAK